MPQLAPEAVAKTDSLAPAPFASSLQGWSSSTDFTDPERERFEAMCTSWRGAYHIMAAVALRGAPQGLCQTTVSEFPDTMRNFQVGSLFTAEPPGTARSGQRQPRNCPSALQKSAMAGGAYQQ
jgi:hypothetical protein